MILHQLPILLQIEGCIATTHRSWIRFSAPLVEVLEFQAATHQHVDGAFHTWHAVLPLSHVSNQTLLDVEILLVVV